MCRFLFIVLCVYVCTSCAPRPIISYPSSASGQNNSKLMNTPVPVVSVPKSPATTLNQPMVWQTAPIMRDSLRHQLTEIESEIEQHEYNELVFLRRYRIEKRSFVDVTISVAQKEMIANALTDLENRLEMLRKKLEDLRKKRQELRNQLGLAGDDSGTTQESQAIRCR